MFSDRVRRRAAALVVAAPVLLVSASALAQPPRTPAPVDATAAEKQALARVKAEQGLKLFGAGRWSEAYEWFREADVLYHAPTLVLYQARCQRQSGKLLAARALYQRILGEPVPAQAPAAFVEAQDNARMELEKLRTAIPRVQFTVADAPRNTVRLTLDGAPLADDAKELDPGPHTLEISGGANEHATKAFTVSEGANPPVEIRLHAPPAASPAAVAPVALAKPPGSYVPGIVALGVGGVVLVAGAAVGGATLSKASSVKAKCTGSVCPLSAQSDANAASTLGNVSTDLFVVGGVAAATGAVLLVVRPRLGGGPKKQGFEWNAGVGIGRIELGGSF